MRVVFTGLLVLAAPHIVLVCLTKVLQTSADLCYMAVPLTQICNPEAYSLETAIAVAKVSAGLTAAFELHLVRFLQTRCLAEHVPFPIIFRGLDVLGGILSESTISPERLLSLMSLFLKSPEPEIASKAVLALGRRCANVAWLRSVVGETDARVRANMIESLWRRKEPEVEAIYLSALKSASSRVVANSTYGLFLFGSHHWAEALNRLRGHRNPVFRRSAVWVITSIALPDTLARLQTLIRDENPQVRAAAFAALKHLRIKNEVKVA